MYEKFTDRARKVMQLSNQEAQRFNHEYIGTEHVLLGLVKEGSGVAATVLRNLGIDLRKIRLEVEKLVQCGPDPNAIGNVPQTPRAKKVIEYAMLEARELRHGYVGTEHILLGLFREQEGVAAQVLMNLGLKLVEVRQEVLNLLAHGVEGIRPQRVAGPPPREGMIAEESPRTPAAGTQGESSAAPLQHHVARVRHKTSAAATKDAVAALAWLFLFLGIAGMSRGIGGGSEFLLPGAILVGASLIALALGRR